MAHDASARQRRPRLGRPRWGARRRAFALTIVGVWGAGLILAALLGTRSGAPTAPVARVDDATASRPEPVAAPAQDAERPTDPGLDSQRVRWVGRDAGPALSSDDRALLRAVFGIDDAARLFVPEAAPRGAVRYAARTPGCAERRPGASRGPACRYVTVHVGLTAPRRATETWDAFVTRVTRGGTGAWPAGAQAYYTGLASLDPEARLAFERLVADARHAGFPVRVSETYRSPGRQALLLARSDGRTATATSIHSYGRAVDLVVGDGRVDRVATVRTWIAFRRWVMRRADGAFRLVGTPERTWDWPHVELAYPLLGFRSVDGLLAAARRCQAAAPSLADAAVRCTLAPHLPTRLAQLGAAAHRPAAAAVPRPHLAHAGAPGRAVPTGVKRGVTTVR